MIKFIRRPEGSVSVNCISSWLEPARMSRLRYSFVLGQGERNASIIPPPPLQTLLQPLVPAGGGLQEVEVLSLMDGPKINRLYIRFSFVWWRGAEHGRGSPPSWPLRCWEGGEPLAAPIRCHHQHPSAVTLWGAPSAVTVWGAPSTVAICGATLAATVWGGPFSGDSLRRPFSEDREQWSWATETSPSGI
jgi:hypothetical protein